MSKIPKYLLEKAVCCVCGNNKTYVRPDGSNAWYKYPDAIRWGGTNLMCSYCYAIIRQNVPGGYNEKRRLANQCRNSYLNIEDDFWKGLVGEVIVAKVNRLTVSGLEHDNFHSICDISPGKIQVKARSLKFGRWQVSHFNNYDFETLCVICMDKLWNNVKRVYVFTIESVINRHTFGIVIIENPSYGENWYEEFRIDEKKYSDVYQDLMSRVKNKKYFYIEDIKKWLKND